MFLIYNNTTQDIYTVSNKDDTIVPSDHTKVELINDIESQKFPAHPCYCQFIDGKITLDHQKNVIRLQKEMDNKKKAEDELLIQDKMREMAIDILKTEGKL